MHNIEKTIQVAAKYSKYNAVFRSRLTTHKKQSTLTLATCDNNKF